jgi:hypothetical protein
MKFFPNNRLKAGIDISLGNIKSALLLKKKEGFSIRTLSLVKIPEDVLKPSFKVENIIDENAFHSCLKQCRKEIEFKKVGVALPDASIKILIMEFTDLPGGAREVNELVLWTVSNSLNLAVDQIRVSWKNMGQNLENKHVFVIALGLEEVLVQYEKAFKRADISPVALGPAGLNQFDFYSEIIPQKGRVAYLGLFDDFLNVFVFDGGIPVFYRLIKKGFLNKEHASAIDDIDLFFQYFYTENPDFEIESLYIASHMKSEAQVGQIIEEMGLTEFTLIDEGQFIDFETSSIKKAHLMQLPFYSGAFGAAIGS